MRKPRRRPYVSLLVLCIVSLMVLSPICPVALAQSNPTGSEWAGPYVDRIQLIEFYEIDMTGGAQALVDGAADIMDHGAFHGSRNIFDTSPAHLDYKEVLRYGYFTVNTNCRRWPLNISGVRRAISLALNKTVYYQGYGLEVVLLDGFLPTQHPLSTENERNFHYYDSDVEAGAAILDNLGFFDIDDDGWREGPGGTEIEPIAIEVQDAERFRNLAGPVLEALHDLNLNATVVGGDYFEILERVGQHGDYDMFLADWNLFPGTDLRHYCREYTSDALDVFEFNPDNWSNSSWDTLSSIVSNSENYSNIVEAVEELQAIWMEEVPRLMLFQDAIRTYYRPDTINGVVNHFMEGAPNYFTALNMTHETDGPIGGTARWAVHTNNFILRPSLAPLKNTMLKELWFSPRNWIEFVYEPMVRMGPEGNEIPWLIREPLLETHEEDSDILEGNLQVTIDLLPDLKWSDGSPITTEDIEYSINFLLDLFHFIRELERDDIEVIEPVNSSRIVIEVDTYFDWQTVSYIPIYPKSLFQESFNSLFSFDNDESRYTLNPEAINELIVSGPFVPESWYPGDTLTLVQNPYYWRNPRSVTTTPFPFDFTIVVAAGAVGIIAVILVREYFSKKRQ
ncbi:MAG: ABC transporter substrate-binding protein [Candidatus Thorarchaeota archaeon]